MKKALFETKRILENIDENGYLFTQLNEVFKMFTGNIKVEVDEFEVRQDLEIETIKTKGIEGSEVDLTGKMEILNIPQFLKYFKVCNDDNDFFENFVLKLSELASIA